MSNISVNLLLIMCIKKTICKKLITKISNRPSINLPKNDVFPTARATIPSVKSSTKEKIKK